MAVTLNVRTGNGNETYKWGSIKHYSNAPLLPLSITNSISGHIFYMPVVFPTMLPKDSVYLNYCQLNLLHI
jgi:hypothetical protein